MAGIILGAQDRVPDLDEEKRPLQVSERSTLWVDRGRQGHLGWEIQHNHGKHSGCSCDGPSLALSPGNYPRYECSTLSCRLPACPDPHQEFYENRTPAFVLCLVLKEQGSALATNVTCQCFPT